MTEHIIRDRESLLAFTLNLLGFALMEVRARL